MQLCELIKSRVECPDFLEKLACAQASVSQNLAGMHQSQVRLDFGLWRNAMWFYSLCFASNLSW